MNTRPVNGIELAYVDQGRGWPIVLVHGFPLDHTMWQAQIDALSNRYRLIVPDLRGFGQSGVTEGVVTMEQFADDLAALLDAIGETEPVILAGLSMGGYIALQFWQKYSSRLRGLVLCDTRAAADAPEVAAARREMANRVLHDGPIPLVDSMLPRLFAADAAQRHLEKMEAVRRVMMAASPQAIAAAALGMAERPDMMGRLADIHCPTLILVGERDVISPPEEMLSVLRAIRCAQFVEIPRAGHLSPLEEPAEVNAALLEFLDTQF